LTSPSESVAIERAGPFWVICAEADLRFFQTVKYPQGSGSTVKSSAASIFKPWEHLEPVEFPRVLVLWIATTAFLMTRSSSEPGFSSRLLCSVSL
jgi:hypothetical protein